MLPLGWTFLFCAVAIFMLCLDKYVYLNPFLGIHIKTVAVQIQWKHFGIVHSIFVKALSSKVSPNLGTLIKLYKCEHYGKCLFSVWVYFFLSTIAMTKVISCYYFHGRCISLLFPTIFYESLSIPSQISEGDRWWRQHVETASFYVSPKLFTQWQCTSRNEQKFHKAFYYLDRKSVV